VCLATSTPAAAAVTQEVRRGSSYAARAEAAIVSGGIDTDTSGGGRHSGS